MAFADEVIKQNIALALQFTYGPLDVSHILFWWRCESYQLNQILDYSKGANLASITAGAPFLLYDVTQGALGGARGKYLTPTIGVTRSLVEFDVTSGDICKEDEGRIGFWLNPSTLGTGCRICLIHNTSAATVRLGLAFDNANSDELAFLGPTGESFHTTIANLAENVWSFVEFSWLHTDAGATHLRKIIVNGATLASSTSAFTTTTNNTGHLRFGDTRSGRNANYGLDQIMISDDSDTNFYELAYYAAFPGTGSLVAQILSNYLDNVSSLTNSLEDVTVGNCNIDLVHDGSLSTYFKNPLFSKQGGTIVLQANSATQVIFKGKGVSPKISKETITISLKDNIADLLEQKIGSSDAPITTTSPTVPGGGYSYIYDCTNPANLVWRVLQYYAGFDGVKATTNRQIDYTTWLIWYNQCASLHLDLRASLEGITAQDILKQVCKLTNSAVCSNPVTGKLEFYMFFPTTSPVADYSFNTDDIITSEVTISCNPIYNDYKVSYGYNKETDTWVGFVEKVDEHSQIIFGVHVEEEKDATIWHHDATSAENMAQRMIDIYKNPRAEITLDTTLKGILVRVGQIISITEPTSGYVNRLFRVIKTTKDIAKGTTKLIGRDLYVEPNWYWTGLYAGNLIPINDGWTKVANSEIENYSDYNSHVVNGPYATISSATSATMQVSGYTSIEWVVDGQLTYGDAYYEVLDPISEIYVRYEMHPSPIRKVYIYEYNAAGGLLASNTIVNDRIYAILYKAYYASGATITPYDLSPGIPFDVHKSGTMTLQATTRGIRVKWFVQIGSKSTLSWILANGAARINSINLKMLPVASFATNSIVTIRAPFNFYRNNDLASSATGNTLEIRLKVDADATNNFIIRMADGTKQISATITTLWNWYKTYLFTLQGGVGHLYIDNVASATFATTNSANNRITFGWSGLGTRASAQIDYIKWTKGVVMSAAVATPTQVVQQVYTPIIDYSNPAPVTGLTLAETNRYNLDGKYIPQIRVTFTSSSLLGATYLIYYRTTSMATYTFITETPLAEQCVDGTIGVNLIMVRTQKYGYSTTSTDSPWGAIELQGDPNAQPIPDVAPLIPDKQTLSFLAHFDNDFLSTDGLTPASNNATITQGWINNCAYIGTSNYLQYTLDMPMQGTLHMKFCLTQSVASMTANHTLFHRLSPIFYIYFDYTADELRLRTYGSTTVCSIAATYVKKNEWHTLQCVWDLENDYYMLMLDEYLDTGSRW